MKTRLASTIGDDAAVGIARELAELTFERLTLPTRAGIQRIVYADPPDQLAVFRDWIDSGWRLMPQPGGDLSQRLEQAFAAGRDPRVTHTIVVGSDCPDITSEAVLAAFDAIDQRTVVVGPTTDGGFYLMGAGRIPEGFFGNIPWSSAVTLRELTARAREHGYRIKRLPTLYDVDTLNDLRRWDPVRASELDER